MAIIGAGTVGVTTVVTTAGMAAAARGGTSVPAAGAGVVMATIAACGGMAADLGARLAAAGRRSPLGSSVAFGVREPGAVPRLTACLSSIDAEAPGQNGLLRMQPIFRFVEHHRLRAVDHGG